MSVHREYKGFELHAHVSESPRGGYVPSVTLTRHNAVNVAERKFDLPVKAPIPDKNKALDIAMRYGCDLVDGQIPGFDARAML